MNIDQTAQLPLWLPYTQMLTAPFPLKIASAKDALLTTDDGKEIIDGISSWWVINHGHCQQEIVDAIKQTAEKLDQIILAGFVHEPALKLAEELLPHCYNHTRLFLSDNGSTAVEVGLKMAVQYWHNLGERRTTFVALENCYHGETFGVMSLGRGGVFSLPFEPLLFNVIKIPAPTPDSWQESVRALEQALAENNVAAFIYEPLLQGSGGMQILSSSGLEQLISSCKTAGVLTIADEVAVGFGRLGRWFGSDFMESKPDIMCFSKGLTGGTLALGATTATEEIFSAFLDRERSKMLLHGHSFAGNPLACAAAVASIELLNSEESWRRINRIVESHIAFSAELSKLPNIDNLRQLGTILAFEIKSSEQSGYYNPLRDRIYAALLARGVLLRPLGNTLYIMPPYSITSAQLQRIYEAVVEVVSSLS